MKYDPVFVMFLIFMGLLFMAVLVIRINEKDDNELSIEDIELFKRLDMVKFSKRLKESMPAAEVAAERLRTAPNNYGFKLERK